ncbi:MAG: PVC-type heme-binding CxxCH protein [Planctomycetota bacterium]|nr:PVC-type heme-binding CxxCH protein [Planctomycetota bacterium]
MQNRILSIWFAALFLFSGAIPWVRSSHCEDGEKAGDDSKPIRALLVTGGCCHDYARQKKILTEGISARTRLKIEWTIVQQGGAANDARIPLFANRDWARGFDIVIHNECFSEIDDKEWIERILKPHREGVNAVVIHCAMHTFRKFGENGYRDFLGVTSKSHGPHHSFKVENLAPSDPVMKGFGKDWTTPRGELYYVDTIGDRTVPLARAFSSGGRKKQEVCVWKNTYGKARVFGTTIGHHNETMSSSRYLDFLTRGFLWAVGRLDEKNIQKAPVKKVPVNLALNRPATSSANQSGHLPRAATDGSLATRSCAPDNGTGYWYQVDLQQPRELTGVQVHWEQDGRLYQFKLEGSADGKVWKELHDGTKNESRDQVQTYPFQVKGIRYLKMTCTRVEPGAWYSFSEFRALGTEMMEVPQVSVSGQGPLNPKGALLGGLKVPPEFEAKVFAEPPEVNYPVCLTSTHDGVLFVGVDKNGSLDRKTGRGSVVKCVDTDRDGQADTITTFCEVDSPRGLVWDRDRLFVLHPPDLSVYFDDDQDGIADREEVLVEGIGFDLNFRGADHTTNGIRMGIDGWIYIAVGDYGFIKATARDGKTMQFRGGGVLRVRPDGTDLEVYTRGLRNICDVAVDPTMNLFTRDNTNDGGGWDIRLSHIIQSAHYGYPSLYKHFNDEIMPPLADYGGGSGTGALYVSESNLPEKYRQALFTCDWGRNKVFYHPLRDAGSTFTAQQEDFVSVPRPTDMDVDAAGNLYVASWRKGQFKYQGENIGFVAVLSPREKSPVRLPDLTKADTGELARLLTSPSHSLVWAVVREIRGRKSMGAVEREAAAILESRLPLANKTAAIAAAGTGFARTQLVKFIGKKDWELVPLLIRFSADRPQVDAATADAILGCLKVSDNRVQMAALVALGRIRNPAHQAAVLKFGRTLTIDRSKDQGVKTPVNTSSKALRHVAVQTLATIANSEVLLAAVGGESRESSLALEALKWMHTPQVVEGLLDYLQARGTDREAWETLIRIYHTEGPYTGDWWGTRPDTTGPYYKRVKWQESDRIAAFIEQQFSSLSTEDRLHVAAQLEKHRIKLPGVAAMAKSIEKQKKAADMVVRIPEFDKSNPHQLGNMKYEEILAELAGEKGNVRQGKRIFQQQSCAACHTIEANAKAIGPQLVDIGLRYKREELLESIVKPTAKIAQGFATQIFATDDGLNHTGFVTREAGDEVEIRTAEGKSIVLKKEAIEARKESRKSVMPEGLVNNLTVNELSSLIAYLQSLKSGKPLEKKKK